MARPPELATAETSIHLDPNIDPHIQIFSSHPFKENVRAGYAALARGNQTRFAILRGENEAVYTAQDHLIWAAEPPNMTFDWLRTRQGDYETVANLRFLRREHPFSTNDLDDYSFETSRPRDGFSALSKDYFEGVIMPVNGGPTGETARLFMFGRTDKSNQRHRSQSYFDKSAEEQKLLLEESGMRVVMVDMPVRNGEIDFNPLTKALSPNLPEAFIPERPKDADPNIAAIQTMADRIRTNPYSVVSETLRRLAGGTHKLASMSVDVSRGEGLVLNLNTQHDGVAQFMQFNSENEADAISLLRRMPGGGLHSLGVWAWGENNEEFRIVAGSHNEVYDEKTHTMVKLGSKDIPVSLFATILVALGKEKSHPFFKSGSEQPTPLVFDKAKPRDVTYVETHPSHYDHDRSYSSRFSGYSESQAAARSVSASSEGKPMPVNKGSNWNNPISKWERRARQASGHHKHKGK